MIEPFFLTKRSIIAINNLHDIFFEKNVLYLILSLIFYFLAAFSSAQGLFVGLTFQLVIIFIFKSSFYKSKIFWFFLIINCLIWGIYLNGYFQLSHMGSFSYVFLHPFDSIIFFLSYYSAPFLRHYGLFSLILGLFIVVLIAYILFDYIFRRFNSKSIFIVSLILFSILVCLSIIKGRLFFGITQSLTSRYTTFSLCLIIAILLYLLSTSFFKLKLLVFIIFISAFSFSLTNSYRELVAYSISNYSRLQTFLKFDTASDASLGMLFGNTDLVKNTALVFKKFYYGPFSSLHSDSNLELNKYSYVIDECIWLNQDNNKFFDDIVVRGWVFRNGRNTDNVNSTVLLKSEKSNKFYLMDSFMVSRNDVTEYFHDGHDYNNSGFYGVISSDYLDFLDNYRIYILYDDGQSIDLIDTKVYLKDK